MLYLDYSREPGEWVPNVHGGNENLEAVASSRTNELVFGRHPRHHHRRGGHCLADGQPPRLDGWPGFGYKWNMGWMHDSLQYISQDPSTASTTTTRSRSPSSTPSARTSSCRSHDEVVHGKGSLINKMPGDEWQKFANLRAYYGFMYAHPGKQLLFMGGEFAQSREWNHDTSLDWHLLEGPMHRGVQTLIKDLNALYKATPALYEVDFEPAGFGWIEGGDRENSVVSFAPAEEAGGPRGLRLQLHAGRPARLPYRGARGGATPRRSTPTTPATEAAV